MRKTLSETNSTGIYSNEQHLKDEKEFNKNLTTGSFNVSDLSNFKRLMVHDLCMDNVLETYRVGNYTLTQVKNALLSPASNTEILLGASEHLMRISPHYNRLNTYISNMALFNWDVDVYDIKNTYKSNILIESYSSLCSQLEKMNLKHEFVKIAKALPCQDIYYGVVCENKKNDFFIQSLRSSMCKLVSTNGVYNFKINLSLINASNIGAYPDYIKKEYIKFHEGKGSNWYTPPYDKQICIKLNQHLTYPFPMLLSIIEDIFDLDTYKKLKLQSAKTDNYKAIAVEVPIDDQTIDKPLLTPPTLGAFAEMNRASLNENVGMLHTLGSKAVPISFKDSNNSRNNVADSTDDLYNSSGISHELFNGSSSGTALAYSIENDSGIWYGVYRQLERWLNRFIRTRNFNRPSFKFAVTLLDMTIYNRDKVIDRYLKAGQNGIPIKSKLMSSLDLPPSRVYGAIILEKELFKLHENVIPLTTSYTQSSESEGGRPTNESQGKTLSDSGEQTQKNDSNSKR